MKVLAINGSPRAEGNTSIIINTVLDELKKEGIQTELIQLANKDISPCKACFACEGNKNCVHKQDNFWEIFQKATQCQGILLGSPVYCADVSANLKAFLDRAGIVCATNSGILRHKVGAGVVALRRAGGISAVDTINHFLLNKEIFVVGSTYWNMVFGKYIGEVLKDGEGINNMRNLGQNMAYLLKAVAKA